MLKKMSHLSGVINEDEILFSTSFNYLFPEAARSAPCLLPVDQSTLDGLKDLGHAMGDPGTDAQPQPAFDSQIPAGFTYFGQFVDHDLTARTDRNSALTSIGNYLIVPLDPDEVVTNLRNGRRPQFDLDSVFGDGPGLAGHGTPFAAESESQALYLPDLTMGLFKTANRVDLPRTSLNAPGEPYKNAATIADMRNEENINIAQLQASMILFYNKVYASLGGSDVEKYVRARQLVRWAYQYAVVHDYLMSVCDKGIVLDTLANGPRYFGTAAGRGSSFMPLEFSVAAFRFGHSMIRPSYKLNSTTTLTILEILGTNGNPANFDSADNQLATSRIVEWKNFIGGSAQKARKIDTKLAKGLFDLPFVPDRQPMKELATRNLLRAYNLSVPHAQACCDGYGVNPLTRAELLGGEDPAIQSILVNYGFLSKTPLWYYVLREAAVQQGGERLGEIGSRIVCETIIGMMKNDPNSYLNNLGDPAVKSNGIHIGSGSGNKIDDLKSLLKFAGAIGI